MLPSSSLAIHASWFGSMSVDSTVSDVFVSRC